MVVQDAENDAKYRCAECNLQFGTPRDLSRHLNKTARHGGQPSPCAICHKPLTRPDSRARHERRCRERFGVTEEMWQGIERERQRGRRKSISVDGADETNKLTSPGDVAGTGCDSAATTATTTNTTTMSSSSSSGNSGRAGRERGVATASCSSRSRTVSVSEFSDAELAAALASSAQVASSAPGPAPSRFVAQPGEPGGSWTRRRSMSLRTPHPPPHPHTHAHGSPPFPFTTTTTTTTTTTKDALALTNGRKRRESSPHARGVIPPPLSHSHQARDAAVGGAAANHMNNAQWRPVNRASNPHSYNYTHYRHHALRDDSPPFDPPSSPGAMQDESDGEMTMVPASAYRPQQHQQHQRWTTLMRRDERLVEDGEEDEVDELAEDEEEDEPWVPPGSSHTHGGRHVRSQEAGMMMTMGPPAKKKLFGFEVDSTTTTTTSTGGGGIVGWSSSKTTQQ